MEKRRLNFMDVLIILIIVAVLAAGIYYLMNKNKPQTVVAEEQNVITIEYEVRLEQTDKFIAELFVKAEEGKEKLWIGEEKHTEAIISECTENTEGNKSNGIISGEIMKARKPDSVDLTLMLQSSATETDTQICLSGKAIRVGEEIVVSGKGFSGKGYVTGLKIVD